MRKVLLLFAVAAVYSGCVAASQEIADTAFYGAHTPHVLREVEVLGVKQMPEVEYAPVTRLGMSQVERLGVVALKGLAEIAPNFYIPDYGSRMTSSIYVRGLGARIDQPVVGLSVDGVPYLNKDNYDFDVPDIERIEVLRGAQSVLNGRNTMGGQVNIHTLSPWRYQGVRLMAEYGRANSLKASAAWYGLLSPTVATSVGGYYTMTDGFWRNGYDGGRVGTERQGSARWKLSWRPEARLSVTNTASAVISRQGGYPYQSVATGALSYNDTCYYRRNSFADGLTIAYAGNRVTANLITSVQYIDDDMTLDQDFTPEDYFTLTQRRHEWAVTQDVFCKAARGRYQWLGGVFGFYRSTDMSAPVTFYDTGISELIEAHRNDVNPSYPIGWDSRSFVLGSDFDTRDRGLALYHESTYRLGDWTFQGGLRWDIERVTLRYNSHCSTGYTTYHVMPDGSREPYSHTPVDIDDIGRLGQTFSQLLPKVSISYNPRLGGAVGSNFSVYATVSKGYKAGGYNTQMFSDVLQQRIMQLMGIGMSYNVDDIISYSPEKSWNYELGLRIAETPVAAAGKISAELSGFFIDCTDQQLTMFPDGTTTGRIMTNAGRTYSRGFEATANFRTFDGRFRAGLSYGFTCATFDEFDNGRDDFAGKRVPYAPSNTLFVSAGYTLPVGAVGGDDLSLQFDASVRGVGDIYWDEANTVRQPFYALLGMEAGVGTERWSAKVWGQNLTATRYNTFYFVSMGNSFVQRGRPVTAGVTLRYHF